MTMPPPLKPGKLGLEEPQEALHRIRITLSSKSIKNLEKGKDIFLPLDECECVNT
jgi:small subunit ribosomal protein S20e